MLDGVTLDQIRTFIAAADEGSFSGAGQRLRRAQSVVSQTLANLEGQLGVKLFDRSGRFPVLTDQGRALLAVARAVEGNVDLFKARAKSLAGGLEPELSVAVDVMFPVETFIAAVAAFQKQFPTTLLKFDLESSAVVEPVLDGRCAIGVAGSWSLTPSQLTREALLKFRTVTVVSPQHPLATHGGPIPPSVLNSIRTSRTRRSGGYLSGLWSASRMLQDLASFASRGQTCLPARRSRVWRLARSHARGGSRKRGPGSDHARGQSAHQPRDSNVGDLSDRQSTRPSGTLVHRAPQARRRSPVEREADAVSRLGGIGCETPALPYASFAREEKKRGAVEGDLPRPI